MTAQGPASASSPATGTPPNPPIPPRPSTTRSAPGTPRSPRSPPATPWVTTPAPSRSSSGPTTPIRCVGIDLAIGIGTAQRQSGDAAFRETLLDAARRAADVGDTARLVAAALANNRGMFSNAATVDGERVAILELALDRLPTDDPDRALVLSTLCAELTYDDSLERRQALADEALAIARSTGDDATTVRVLNHISFAAVDAAPARSVVGVVGGGASRSPSASVTPSSCSGQPTSAPASPCVPATSTRRIVAARSPGPSPSGSTSRRCSGSGPRCAPCGPSSPATTTPPKR